MKGSFADSQFHCGILALRLDSDTGTPAQQRAFPHQPTETPPLEPASCHGAPSPPPSCTRRSLSSLQLNQLFVGLSALTLRVAGAAVDGLFHVTAVGLISIVQIAVSGGSGNVFESVVTECAVGRRGPQVRRSCLQVESEGGVHS